MQDITDDTESEDAYIPVNEADSTMYYDTEASMIPDEEANTSFHNEEVNNAPHRNIPTDMIQMNDSLTVSTVTNEVITQMETPTATENNQLTLLSEADEDENQDKASQSSEHNMDSTVNASQDENNHNAEQQNNMEPASEDTNVGTLLDEEMDAKYGSRITRWNLRQRKQQTYDHKYDGNAEIYVAQSTDATMATPQMPIHCSLKLFGSAGISAVKAELQQLHDLKVMEAKPLSPTQKREALGYLMFLKRKRNGKNKARGCADG